MEIHGIQKMTLLDYPEKVACTIFTARCNFRCPFCHNASLVTHVDAAAAISEEEVFSFLAKRLLRELRSKQCRYWKSAVFEVLLSRQCVCVRKNPEICRVK